MLVKFKTSDNILKWKPTLVQVSELSEMFCFVKITKLKKMNYIESELDAIERIELLREFNEENNIIKPEAYYYYAKLAIIEMNDKGYNRLDEHYFRNTNNEIIKIFYN